ncbi:unnamed protein product [Cochlearia groenlandica]
MMNHLVQRPQVKSFLKILTCRFTILRYPKTIPKIVFSERGNIDGQNFELEGQSKFLQAARKPEIVFSERGNIDVQNMESGSVLKFFLGELLKLININLRDKNMEPKKGDWMERRKKFVIYSMKLRKKGLKLPWEIYRVYPKEGYHGIYFKRRVLSSMLSSSNPLMLLFDFLRLLEFIRPKVEALATLRKSERLFTSHAKEHNGVYKLLVYSNHIIAYKHRGKIEDLRRFWSACKDMESFDVKGHSRTTMTFWFKDDIEGAHEVLEKWETGEYRYFEVNVSLVLKLRHSTNHVMKKADSMIDKVLEDDDKKRLQENMVISDDAGKCFETKETGNNEWDSLKKNLVLSAYACVQYIDGRRDIESVANVMRLLKNQEGDNIGMDTSDRLSLKLVETIRGGGAYIGSD